MFSETPIHYSTQPSNAKTIATVLSAVPKPYAIAGAGILAVGAALWWLFKDDDEEDEVYNTQSTVEPAVQQPLPTVQATAEQTVARTVELTVDEPLEAVEEPFDDATDEWDGEDWDEDEIDPVEDEPDEEAEKEQLRQVMSRLGKKSAAARAKKKAL